MPAQISKEDRTDLFRKCHYSLLGHGSKSPAETLSELAQSISRDIQGDFYGSGKLIEDFEKKIARVLGFPAAVFMPSGTMAQPIALRIWSDRKGLKKVGFHPKSHLEVHEHKAYSFLHHLESVLIGDPEQVLTLEDLKACPSQFAALLLELPQRDLGGLLPPWKELVAISSWAKENRIAFHLDGARLWECQPYYNKSYSEIAGLFDSVYVSFYKGLGGIAGAILAGDEGFISEAKIWQRRQGGNLISLYPYILSADRSFDSRLGRMALYHQRAKEIAEILKSFSGVRITPDIPHVNMFNLQIQKPLENLNQALLEMAQEYDIHLLYDFNMSSDSQSCWTEVTIGDAALNLSMDQISEFFKKFFKKLSS